MSIYIERPREPKKVEAEQYNGKNFHKILMLLENGGYMTEEFRETTEKIEVTSKMGDKQYLTTIAKGSYLVHDKDMYLVVKEKQFEEDYQLVDLVMDGEYAVIE